MIFYVTLVLALVVFLVCTGGFLMDVIDPEGFFGFVIGGIISLFVGAFAAIVFMFLILGTANMFIPKETNQISETTINLRALDSGSEVSGRYFVGSVYIDEKKVLEYISEAEDGGMRVESVPAKDSVIYERDAENPKVTIRKYEEINKWLSPEALYTYEKYEFEIPKGSVKESYDVSVGDKE